MEGTDQREQDGVVTSESPPVRKRLQLKPRSKDAGKVGGYSSKKSNIFGAAKPRELVLEKKGVDWKKKDEELSKRLIKLPTMSSKQEEEFAALEAEISFAKKEIREAETDEAKAKAEAELVEKEKEKKAFIDALMKERRERKRYNAEENDGNFRREGRGGRRDGRRGGHRDGDNNGDFSSFGGRRRHQNGGGRQRGGSYGDKDGGGRQRGGSFGGDREEAENKIFVGSLAWAVDDMALGEAFCEQGFDVIGANVVMDRDDSTRSRGFGYVTFADAHDARKAMETMDGFEICGRSIRVDKAMTRRSRGSSFERRGGGHNSRGHRDGGFGRDGGF